jgi:hypothetical protein
MKSKTKIALIILLFSSFIMFASFGGQKVEWKGTIEKEDGIKVIKNPREPLYGEIKFELEEDLSIGREDEDNYMFYRVRDIEVDNQGNIYVADMSNCRVQKFDKNGVYLQTIGRLGQGPGEFERPTILQIDDLTGKLYVKDSTYSIEIFDDQGNHIEEIRLEDSPFDFKLDKNGNILGILTKITESGTFHTLCKINSEGEIEENYAEFPYTWIREQKGEATFTFSLGHELSMLLSILDDKRFVYGYSKEYELNVMDSEGQVLIRIKKDEPYPKFSEKEQREYRRFKIPEYKPYFYGLFTDSEGRIYVQRNKTWQEENVEKEVDIFSKDGYYLYKTRLPQDTYIIENGYLYALEVKDMEFVKRYKIKNWDRITKGI